MCKGQRGKCTCLINTCSHLSTSTAIAATSKFLMLEAKHLLIGPHNVFDSHLSTQCFSHMLTKTWNWWGAGGGVEVTHSSTVLYESRWQSKIASRKNMLMKQSCFYACTKLWDKESTNHLCPEEGKRRLAAMAYAHKPPLFLVNHESGTYLLSAHKKIKKPVPAK